MNNSILHHLPKVERNATLLVTGALGVGKSRQVCNWSTHWNIPIHKLNAWLLTERKPSNWAHGIFSFFLQLNENCIVHIEDFSSLFPSKSLREDLYGAMLLGYQDASSRYDVILIAETITKESIHPFALTLFKYNIEVPSIHATVDKLEPLFSNGHDEDSYTNVEIVADRIVGFQENDFQTLKLELLSQDLLETRKANYCLKSGISQKKKILNAIENIGKRDSVIKDSITSTRWSDIGGYSKAKQLLEQSVIWYYKYADSFRSLNLTPSKGTILYGPPGCGKTMLAKSVAVESGAAFLPVSVPSLIKGEIGESEKAIANLFAEARSMSPCIVFLDEIDSIFSNRVGMGDLALKLYAQLVAELDLIGNDMSQIMILATTNHIEQIDPGLLRSGRLDRIIHISLPTYTDRKDILRVIFAASKIRIDFSFEHIAELMEGMSGSDIYECIRRATLVAMEGKVACDTILFTEANIVDELERS